MAKDLNGAWLALGVAAAVAAGTVVRRGGSMSLVPVAGEERDSHTKTRAFHCGASNIKTFSLKFVGLGEGLSALGPGMYFNSSRVLAERYCKYVSNPTMYEVSLDTSGFYDSTYGMPLHLRKGLSTLVDSLVESGKLEMSPGGNIRGVSPLTHGPGYIGAVFKALGAKEGRVALIKIGITGALEKLPSGAIEYAVYDEDQILIQGATTT